MLDPTSRHMTMTASRSRVRRLASSRDTERVELACERLEALGPFEAAVAVNCQQLFEPHGEAMRRLADVLAPGGRFVSLTHDWAIERQAPRPTWSAMVERDAHAAGFVRVSWDHGHYRSGAATVLVAVTGVQAPGPDPR